ncbi:type 1 glutamine amidotransferase domain-containing protein [Aestuariibacter halophilus]|uniref:Type 1 glutamine amidotransferase domain-containing protein n=1 Tax=Fluctibacter halophilus TaxID=226011 RepID=A0ABS8G943_9ALTE|nr:type 1 glutamine amidotransferase domain-containing protein [Aestuariibacter halophilus]MCC2616239.1 type 1 glutamine amidotransferase domain-containing protein [Aestuariibacter halophilus]
MRQFLFTVFALWLTSASLQAQEIRVGMLISGYGNESRPELSYDLEELAQAYLILHDNGVAIDILTPQGGAVLVKDNKDALPYIQRFKSLALEQLNNTLSVTQVQASDYHGVFIVGGDGAMFDLPSDPATQSLLSQFANAQMPMAAVCHGPAAIADIRLKDGTYLVANKQVNSFTNAEEHAFSAETLDRFPFMIEDRLKANGGVFVHNVPMLPFVAADGHLITAQNPSSVPAAAEAFLIALGGSPKPREPFRDEATMALIDQTRQGGSVHLDIALAKAPERYDLNYLALYGFYAYAMAPASEKARELGLMEAIARHFQHPVYESRLITGLVEHGHQDKARKAFADYQQRYPDAPDLEALRKRVVEQSAE